jgi:hypothetical protein
MRYASSALDDFYGIVRGVSADQRTMGGRAELTSSLAWRLKPVPMMGTLGTLGTP